MDYFVHKLSLDMHSTISQGSISVKKGDTKRKICAVLTENGKVYHIEDACTAVFSARKDNGDVLYNECTIVDNIIEYKFTELTTNRAGKMDCEIKLYDANNGLVTSPQFTVVVEGVVYKDKDVESSDEFSAITALVSETTALKKEIEAKLDITEKLIVEAEAATKTATDTAAELRGMAESGAFDGEKGEKGDPGIAVEKEWTLIEDVTLTEKVGSMNWSLSEQNYTEVWIEGTLIFENASSETRPAFFAIGRSANYTGGVANVKFTMDGFEPGETTLYMRAKGYIAPTKKPVYEAALSRYEDKNGEVYRNAGASLSRGWEKIDVINLYCCLVMDNYGSSDGVFAAGTNIKIWGR